MESKRSESIMNLAAALAIAQGQILSAPKDAEAGSGSFKYKYATLDSIWEVARKPLSENGLSVVQIPTNDETGFCLETVLIHSSGEWMSGQMSLPISSGKMTELQAMGSAITYARRYMLGAIVGITTGDDDDGQKAISVHRGDDRNNKPAQSSGMTLDKLFDKLNGVVGMRGFYKSALEILDCRRPSAILPEADDTDGWRVLFVDARDHALEEIKQSVEVKDTEQPDLFNDDAPADDAPPGAFETE